MLLHVILLTFNGAHFCTLESEESNDRCYHINTNLAQTTMEIEIWTDERMSVTAPAAVQMLLGLSIRLRVNTLRFDCV